MRVVCKYCKEEIDVEPFIYNPRILTTEGLIPEFESRRYEARADIKFICSCCGVVNDWAVFNDTKEKDIIKLAIGE